MTGRKEGRKEGGGGVRMFGTADSMGEWKIERNNGTVE